MESNVHGEDAINSNIRHPSHSDPLRVGAYLAAASFVGTLIGLFAAFPTISVGVPFVLATIVSALLSTLFVVFLRRYQLKRDAAYFEAKREEDRMRTEKAIAEMKRKEAEKA